MPWCLKARFSPTAPLVSTVSVACSLYTDPGNVTSAQTAVTVFGNLCTWHLYDEITLTIICVITVDYKNKN